MSDRTHCDGPGCTETIEDPIIRRLSTPPWMRLDEAPDSRPRDFHSRECLARWANQQSTVEGDIERERIAINIEKANRKLIDKRIEDIDAKPHIVDVVLAYAAQIARTAGRSS